MNSVPTLIWPDYFLVSAVSVTLRVKCIATSWLVIELREWNASMPAWRENVT
jgi:hypothetical protein